MPALAVWFISAQFVGAMVAAVVALVAWQQRKQPGSLPLTLLMLAVTAWGISAGTKSFVSIEQKYLWDALEILMAGISSAFYLVFILEYVRQEKLIRRRTLLLLWLMPVVLALLALSGERAFLFGTPAGAISGWPPAYFAFLLYYYALRLSATFLLARAILGFSQASRAQAWILAGGALAPWLGNLAYAALAPAEQFLAGSLELHPLAYALGGLTLGWGMLRYRILEIVPLARDLAIENLRDVLIIVDFQNRIVDLNHLARELLQLDLKRDFGRPIAEALAAFPELVALLGQDSAADRQIYFPAPHRRYYDIENSLIFDRNNRARGRLIMLHDITERKRIEANLTASQATLNNILEAAPFPLAITRLADGQIVYANPVAVEFYELAGRGRADWRAELLFDDLLAGPKLVEQLRANPMINNLEMRLQTLSGQSRWVLTSLRQLKYQGEACVVSAQMDISERKKVEEELHQGRAQLKLIFDYAGLGIMVIDREGRYQFVNDRWAEMLGVAPAALIGQDEIAYLFPSDVPYNREQQRALVAGEIRQYRIENRYVNSFGRYFWGETSVSGTLNAQGEVEATIGFVIDITKRKQAELALRETERRFREILENIQLLALMLDAEGNVTFCNHHLLAVTGWQRADLLGRNWFTRFLGVDESARLDFARAVRRGALVSHHESSIQDRSGNRLVISWSNMALKDENGQTIGMASLGEDITERRRAHEAEHEQRVLAESLTDTSAALVSTLDLNETLYRILKNVGKVVQHDAANVGLLHGKYVNFFRTHVLSDDENVPLEQLKTIQIEYKRIPTLREMYLQKTPVVISNTHHDPRWVTTPDSAEVRSYIGAPIIVNEKVAGFLSLNSEQAGFFNQSHLQRLQVFCAQAAVAINNSRLYERSRHELEERRKAQSRLRRANKRLETKVAEIEMLQARLREQVIRDPLTGLYNRRYLDETLLREVARAERDDLPIAILMFDIDRFKSVNDTYGHEAGDLLLKSLAGLLLKESRRSDIACRFGGEEFCVVMPGAPLEIARMRAESWRKAFQNFGTAYKHHTLQATVSIGVAIYPEHGRSGAEVLRAADAALYTAKNSGRNKIIVAALPEAGPV